MIKTLEWDSKLFGFSVGVISLLSEPDWEQFLAEFSSQASNYKLIYFITAEKLFVPQNILQRFNGHFINQRIVYRKATKQSDIRFPTFIEEHTDRELTSEFLQLAYISGSFSRFRIDQNIPEGKFEELYRLWIKNSLEKKIADRVFVSSHRNKVTAMVSCKNNDAICNIGLVAVNDSEQGKGTGKYLIQKIEEQAYNMGLKDVQVPTQSNNKNACSFYEKLGFNPIKISNYYHFWIQ